jgi:hypothetical protein
MGHRRCLSVRVTAKRYDRPGGDLGRRGDLHPTQDAARHANFILVSGIGLHGGFSGRETRRDQRNWKKNPTVLSGEIGDPDGMADNVYHVMTGSEIVIQD